MELFCFVLHDNPTGEEESDKGTGSRPAPSLPDQPGEIMELNSGAIAPMYHHQRPVLLHTRHSGCAAKGVTGPVQSRRRGTVFRPESEEDNAIHSEPDTDTGSAEQPYTNRKTMPSTVGLTRTQGLQSSPTLTGRQCHPQWA
ncbi:hypothetical protein ACOMHN_008072 [Nucella lapillus]